MIIGYCLDPRFSISILLLVCMNFDISIEEMHKFSKYWPQVKFSNIQTYNPNVEEVENF